MVRIKLKVKQLFVTRKLRKRLQNKNFTILSSNCLGGCIYHDLGEKFLSPTINLWFNSEDFLKFVNDLDYYLNKCELIQNKNTSMDYPVGNLGEENKKITVYFTHYSNFESAKKKWDARKKRITNNIFIIFTDMDGGNNIDTINRFNALPYKHKIMLTGRNYKNMKNTFYIKGCSEDGHLGEWWQENGNTGRYFYQQFDYVSFLNNKD
ncbi:MAG: DUF1919 domain-containing protein [Lactobacillus sp.]|nr:DUF1919 domain-containing protein [Lactobacillus sp.]